MSFIVGVSQAERAQGALNPDSHRAAYEILHEQGVVLLRGVFLPTGVDSLYQEFCARYGGIDQARMAALSQRPPPNPVMAVGEGRFDIALRMEGAFGQPGLFANPILMKLLLPLLGDINIMRLGNFTAVTSYPGALIQHYHRDHSQLFMEFPDIGPKLPIHAVNVSVPLIDVDLLTGPTGIWPGSHRWPENLPTPEEGRVSIPFQRGDCILMDYRTLHAGLPNFSQTIRPILYMVYCREWFFDDNNHRHRVPMDIPLDSFPAFSPEVQKLLLRAYSQTVRMQPAIAPA